MQGFAEFAYSRVETEQTFTKPVFITTALNPTPAGLQPFTYNIIYGPGVAGNPFGGDATFTGNLQGLGTRNREIESDTYRVLARAALWRRNLGARECGRLFEERSRRREYEQGYEERHQRSVQRSDDGAAADAHVNQRDL